MKGYRTPSWFRMKGLLKRKQAGLAKDRRKPGKPRGMGRR